ncbi:hypothetical protein [Piscinibacter terrae]|uniref:Chalcone isomerase domain-containing protein n=1 Tax=Piscinibacter terrae TaxID=2496871 RepID=A0A3N7HNZ1_9BURK|nr:hypothetical protein [Albitalea terrae]RQP23840.1 hypothetical protein DZC73_17145 [Albitalea terrae]
MNVIARWLTAGLLSLCALSATASAAIDPNLLLEDLKQQKLSKDDFRLAIWMPAEFFIASNGNSSDDQKRQLSRLLDGYVLFMVLDAQLSPMATVTPTPRAELLQKTNLVINGAAPLSPLKDTELKQDFKTFREIMRPVLKNMAGPTGDAMELLVFKLPAGGPKVIQPTVEGRLKLTVNGHVHAWRLPLGSLLPPMMDPENGDSFPGNYKFSPFSGKPLQPQ